MNSNKPHYLLTFEWDAKNELLEIHGNQKGLEKLKSMIDSLLSRTHSDHTHLMTNDMNKIHYLFDEMGTFIGNR